MLTVRNSEEDKVAALDAGADDFVTKPFSTPELMARIRAALRRVPSAQSSPKKIRVGKVVIDFDERTVSRESVSTHLTPKELDLLRYLTQHANQVVSHRELLQAVWGPGLRRPSRLPTRLRQELAKEDGTESRTAAIHHDQPWVGYRLKGQSNLYRIFMTYSSTSLGFSLIIEPRSTRGELVHDCVLACPDSGSGNSISPGLLVELLP